MAASATGLDPSVNQPDRVPLPATAGVAAGAGSNGQLEASTHMWRYFKHRNSQVLQGSSPLYLVL